MSNNTKVLRYQELAERIADLIRHGKLLVAQNFGVV